MITTTFENKKETMYLATVSVKGTYESELFKTTGINEVEATKKLEQFIMDKYGYEPHEIDTVLHKVSGISTIEAKDRPLVTNTITDSNSEYSYTLKITATDAEGKVNYPFGYKMDWDKNKI